MALPMAAMALLAACVDTTRPPRVTDAALGIEPQDAGPTSDDASSSGDAATEDGAIASDASSADATTTAGTDAESTEAGPTMTDATTPDATTTMIAPRLYPEGLRHSPIDAELAAHLRALAARNPARQDDVFAKIGDSITVSTSFLACFGGTRFDLGGREHLRPTLEHFLAGDAAGTTPYARVSLAAGVGWSASRALTGTPSPLRQELDALAPRFAVLMYGTNDVGFVDYDSFLRNLAAIVDTALAEGTIPVLSSIPPRDDDAGADARVPAFGGLVRALASARGVPFVDYYRELLPLPDHGLARDGVHPRAAPAGACVLTPDGLQYAANVRNLLVLEALDRLRSVVVAGGPAPDAVAPRLVGSGTRAAPFLAPALPFSAAADTRSDGAAEVDRWTACSNADESGPEVRYRFTLAAPARVTATVASGAGADVDVHLVRAGAGPEGCVARADREVAAELDAGAWEVVVDTYASGGSPLPGELFLYVR